MQASVVAALGLYSLDSVVVAHGPHVGASWTGDHTGVRRTAGRILNHWTTREACRVPIFSINFKNT